MRLITVLILFASVTLAVSATNVGVDDRGVLSAIAQAPAKTRSWKNPYDGQHAAVAAGEKLFRRHCSECHGVDARGRGKAANLRSSAVQNATPGELDWFLRNGNLRRGMPSWSGLSEQRRWQIISYVKSLGSDASSASSPVPRARTNNQSGKLVGAVGIEITPKPGHNQDDVVKQAKKIATGMESSLPSKASLTRSF